MQRRPNAGLKLGLGAVAVLFAAACGAGGGGGGGGGAAMTGGTPGSTCNTKYNSEGCVGNKKTGCVALPTDVSPDAGVWKDLGDCTSSEYCIAEANPSDAAKKIAVCKPLQTGGGTDTVGAGDGTAGGDSTTVGDAISYAQSVQCVKTNCLSEFSACKADAGCGPSANCFEKCTTEACADACPDMPDGNSAGMALGMCMMQKGCIPTSQPEPVCGNSKCETGETSANCSQDCKTTGPVCGNGTCESGETNANCASDCKATGPVCGDKKCEGNEIEMCPQDCQTGPKCGNGTCESGETTTSCPSDCKTTAAKCGDLKCDAGESTNCPLDCNTQYASSMTCAVNGCSSQWAACMNDAKCKGFFNCAVMCDCNQSCIQECGMGIETNSAAVNIVTCSSQKQCPDPCAGTGPVCGNGKCESGETKTNCSKDCGSATPVCGNGTCETGETASSCAKDCGTSTGHACDQYCGTQAPSGCYCDAECKNAGDCCTPDGKAPTSANKTCGGSTCVQCNGAP